MCVCSYCVTLWKRNWESSFEVRGEISKPVFLQSLQSLSPSVGRSVTAQYIQQWSWWSLSALLKLLQVNERTTESLDRATICSSLQSDMLNSPFCDHSNSSKLALTGDFPGNQKETGTAVSGDTFLSFAYLVIICYDGFYWGYCITPYIFIAEGAVVFSG